MRPRSRTARPIDVERIDRVIFIESTTANASVLHEEFAGCGEIRGIYPSDPAVRPGFYIEFYEDSAVKRSRAVTLSDTKVDILAFNPHLVAGFDMAAPALLPQPPQAEAFESAFLLTSSSSYSIKSRPQTNRNGTKRRRPSTYTSISPTSPTSLAESAYIDSDFAPRPFPPALTDRISADRNQHISTRLPQQPSIPNSTDVPMHGPLLDAYSPVHGGPLLPLQHPSLRRNSSDFSSGIMPTPLDPIPRFPNFPGTSLSSQEPIDFEATNHPPEEIVGMLSTYACSAFDCDKWMIAAGQYRRGGNIAAAVTVVSAMLEVMTSPMVGMDAAQLKPAQLMLASCHLDLARRARGPNGAETATSRALLEKARGGLQQVYGPFVAPPAAPPPPPPTPSRAAPPPSAAPKRAPSESPEKLAQARAQTGQIKILEREIQALRDRQADQAHALEAARVGKRKAEDAQSAERHARRKTEKELEAVEADLVVARRREDYALEQCRAEVERRRRVEAEAEERQRVAEELEGREKRAREYFAKLGVYFLKASQGAAVELSVGPSPFLGGAERDER